MKLHKYEHACFAVEQDGKLLVVDPGNFTSDFVPQPNISAVVITHEHPDHFDTAQLAAIVAQNPQVQVVAHASITEKLTEFHTRSVAAGDTVTIDGFELAFYGSEHAMIHPGMPVVANLGVFIHKTIYYPGDSFVQPHTHVPVLALPVAAPWLKISEVIDFVRAVNPDRAFPTHDAILSDAGKSLPDRMIPQLVPSVAYERITTLDL